MIPQMVGRLRLGLTISMALMMLSCEGQAPFTQLLVVVDGDTAIRQSIARLDVTILGAADRASLEEETRPDLSVYTRESHPEILPRPFVLQPTGGDATRVFDFLAEAYDDKDMRIGVARTITGYVQGKALRLNLWLDESCRSKAERCAQLGQSCRSGACVTAELPEASLVALDSDTPIHEVIASLPEDVQAQIEMQTELEQSQADPSTSCDPDARRACSCGSGEEGTQRCQEDGSGWADCACAMQADCSPGQFERSPATDTDSRVCQALSECGANERESVMPTASSDRECSCLEGYQPAPQGAGCVDIDECDGVDCGPGGSCTHGEGEGTSGRYQCSCADGYTGGGEGTACEPSKCPALQIPQHASLSPEGDHTFGQSVRYSCAAGYSLSGMAERSCTEDGSWSGEAPVCNEVDECEAGLADCDPNAACRNTAGSFDCSCGEAYLDQSSDGQGPGRSCVFDSNCQALGCGDYSHCEVDGDTRACACDAGYRAQGGQCTPVDCGGLSSPENGLLQTPGTTYGSAASYSCKSGYTLSGQAGRSCQADGTWTGTPPVCVLQDCGIPSAPAGGSVTAAITTYGGTAGYLCDDGYSLSGAPERSCIDGGIWSGDMPSCLLQDCLGEGGGSAVEDQCGSCDSDPGNDCVQDCAGEWGGSAQHDACGICNGDGKAQHYLDSDGDGAGNSSDGSAPYCSGEAPAGWVTNDDDGCPDDADKLAAGACGCGVADSDRDSDGTLDCNDLCPDDPDKLLPGDCGCGVTDTDSDGDSTPDCDDLCPDDSAKVDAGDCGCGVADTDADSDGTPDCNELCPDDPDKLLPGDCGCGVADDDTDSDGSLDCNEQCPDDPDKLLPGDCGCGIVDTNSDGDALSDCIDPEPACSSNDTAVCGLCGNTGCTSRPSCSGDGLACDDDGSEVSCCLDMTVLGGTFPMGQGDPGSGDYYSNSSFYDSERPEHDVTVASFEMDVFEVTVGRFRTFVEAFEGGWVPSEGDGKHPLIADSGWLAAWDPELPADGTTLRSLLKCDATHQTWTDTADASGEGERYPINCVNWFEAFAFCAWDGGRLATEAEWEYAAAGGSENRQFPWGNANPTGYANYASSGNSSFLVVGSFPTGEGVWGQHDLAGSMYEWALDAYDGDFYSGAGTSCVNCANLDVDPGAERLARGGGFSAPYGNVRAAGRYGGNGYSPRNHSYTRGFRCVRLP